ncbi:MAG: helix-turn-helix domain-containing protein [Thermoplasmatota archaeon]
MPTNATNADTGATSPATANDDGWRASPRPDSSAPRDPTLNYTLGPRATSAPSSAPHAPTPKRARPLGSGATPAPGSGGEGDLGARSDPPATTATTIVSAPLAAPTATLIVVAATTASLGATLAFFALYHRVRGDAMLAQTTRRRVFESVRASSGASVRDAALAVGVTPTTASYHLERLVSEGLLTRESSRGTLVYFAFTSENDATMRKARAALANEAARRVLDAISASEGVAPSRASLARALDVSVATIAWHLDTLAAAGLVEKTRCGRALLVRVTPLASRARCAPAESSAVA